MEAARRRPGQAALNLLAAASRLQNPLGAPALLDFLLHRLHAANASGERGAAVHGGGGASGILHAARVVARFLLPRSGACFPGLGRPYSLLAHSLAFSGVVFAAVLAHGAWRRQRSRVLALKADFLADGVDLTRVDDRVETLTYLREMKKPGAPPGCGERNDLCGRSRSSARRR